MPIDGRLSSLDGSKNMPVSRSATTKSVRTGEQQPYLRYNPLDSLDKSEAIETYLSKESYNLPSPSSTEQLAFTGRLTWRPKLGEILTKEVQRNRLTEVPKLVENLLTDEAISKGVARAKCDGSFTTSSTTFLDIIARIRDVPLRISKLIVVNFWPGRREDVVEPETTGLPMPMGSYLNAQPMTIDDATTRSSDQDSQTIQLDENVSLTLSSDEDNTEVGDNAVPPSAAKGKEKEIAREKCRKPLPIEEETTIFLNRIVDQIREAFGINTKDPKRRVFSSRFKHNIPSDAPVNYEQKPDCVVVKYNVSIAERACWSDIHSLIEIKKSSAVSAIEDAYSKLLHCARMVLAAQHTRRFVLGATISGTAMVLFVFDRSGVVGSKTFDINKESELLIRVICGLIFVDDSRLGFDTKIKKKGEKGYTISMNGIELDCGEPAYIDCDVYGRGAGCFVTVHEGEYAVIKDSWADDSREGLEYKILDKVKDVEGVVRIIDHEIIQVEEEYGSATKLNGFNMIEARTHRRILMRPLGQPLESFSSLRELMLVIKDIIKTIEDLAERKVLHRNINLRNIILAKADPNDPNSRIRGYLTGFGYALDLENILEDVENGARTGTLPFMASEMLDEQTVNETHHAYYHDLESVFYTLCWFCISQEGPYNTPRHGCKLSESICANLKWNHVSLKNSPLDTMQVNKFKPFRNNFEFRTQVLPHFAPYFQPLKSTLCDLRKIMLTEPSLCKYSYSDDVELATINKDILANAREKGDAVDSKILAHIPSSDRDHRDVFQSLYEIVDRFLVGLEEPKVPLHCRKSFKRAAVKKMVREELDFSQPVPIRELVEGNVDTTTRIYREEGLAETRNFREKNRNDGMEPFTSVFLQPYLTSLKRARYDEPDDESNQSTSEGMSPPKKQRYW